MKLALIAPGKIKLDFAREGVAFYAKRLSRYLPFEAVDLPDVRATKLPPEKVSKLEGDKLLAACMPDGLVVALDEHGKRMNSTDLADWLQQAMNRGARHVSFLVGGPFGHSNAVKQRADLLLSLSDMTLPHDMARLVVAEQLYRAMTILRNEPYHHG